MKDLGRILTGVILVALGLYWVSEVSVWQESIGGIVIILLGVYIFFNKHEDEIEEIGEN